MKPKLPQPYRANEPPPPQFDEDGFLLSSTPWTPEISRWIARLDGIGELGKRHWAIIDFLRDHHLRYGSLPAMRLACHAAGLNKDAVGSLFGGCREAWRVAGLENPGEEAKTYM